MIDSYDFLKLTIDSLSEHIVVVDSSGLIRFVNRAWVEFGQENSCATPLGWDGVNYLHICEMAAASGDDFGLQASKGIRQLMKDRAGTFVLEYPCNSPEEKRWFMMTTKHIAHQGDDFFLITHRDITKRKLAEETVAQLARLDGLTGIANRRAFNDFLELEWSRCIRQKQPITLALIDIDYFKLVNDTYGHHAGDECLKKIAAVLDSHRKRPGDFCARFGGEEFACIFGDSTSENVCSVVDNFLGSIQRLGIPNELSPVEKSVTASAGIATIHPTVGMESSTLIEAADRLLYQAKNRGRNQTVLG